MATKAKSSVESRQSRPLKGAVSRARQSQDGETKSRRYDPSETRTRILNAAYQLFGSRGYSHTGTADIAALADVSEGSIFYHFGAKKALLGELGVMHAQRICAAMQEMDSLDSLPLRVSVWRCFKFCEENNVWQEVDLEATSEKVVATKNAEVAPFYEAAKERVVIWTKAHLDALMMRRTGPKVDTAIAAHLVCAVIGEAMRQYFLPETSPEQKVRVVEEAIQFCERALSFAVSDPLPA